MKSVISRLSFVGLLLGLLLNLITTAEAVAQTASSPVLQAGDVLRISVWQKPELSGEFPVLSDGRIGDPFYMPVLVAGVPLPAAMRDIQSHVEQYETNPIVLVEPLYRVVVGGEVRQPGVYLLSPETTVMEAVIEAGGPTDRGRRDRVRLLRSGRDNSLGENQALQDPIRSGDQVFVDQRRSIFRDYVVPVVSVVGSVASVLRYFQ